jgi:hypothetical protein
MLPSKLNLPSYNISTDIVALTTYLPIISPQLTFMPLDIFLINLNIHQRALGPCHHRYQYLVEITNYVVYDGLGR